MEKLKAVLSLANVPFVFAVNFTRNYPKAALALWFASLIATAWYL